MFLGLMVDKNLNWSNHSKIIENKIFENILLLYKAKIYLNQESVTTLYFSFFHSYLSYGNIAWRTWKTKLKKIIGQQRQVVKVIALTDINLADFYSR